MKTYIHYGSYKFDINKFNPVINSEWTNKPYGGLWASPVECKNISWYDWCINNDFHTEKLDKSFTFTLKDDSKIFTLSSVYDVVKLYKIAGIIPESYRRKYMLATDPFNCVELMLRGYQAIEFECNNYQMYDAMYGWDVDSILILDPSIIICE